MECEERQEVRERQTRERELQLLCQTGGEAQNLPAIPKEDGQTAGVEQAEELDLGVKELRGDQCVPGRVSHAVLDGGPNHELQPDGAEDGAQVHISHPRT